MNPKETFRTRKEAMARIKKMSGWAGARPMDFHIPEDPKRNRDGEVWCIHVKRGFSDLFLRTDGMVE